MNTTKNPFRPGHGGLPPCIAGRKEEQALFRDSLDILAEEPLNRSIVMCGPRGMGKTTLLNWLETECESRNMLAATITPHGDAKGELPITKFAGLLPDKLNLDEVSVSGRAGANFGILAQGAFTLTWRDAKGNAPRTLETHLLDACEDQPRVLLVDEAHTLNESACRGLLNMAQHVMKRGRLLLVLAGTPGLEPFLYRVHATFVERARIFGVGRLSPTASAEVIRTPLADHNITIAEEALSHIVADAQCYPFFLQLWGAALWKLSRSSGQNPLTVAQLPFAKTIVEAERQDFYERRYESIRSNKVLLAAARAVGEAFQQANWQPLDIDDIDRIVADSLVAPRPTDHAQETQALVKELTSMDYFWKPNVIGHAPAGQREPGIPSFMAYLLSRG